MSQTEIRRFLDAVAAGGPPTHIDVDAAMGAGRRRRRRRTATVALASAAALAVVGVIVATGLPSRTGQPPIGHQSPAPTPTISQPSPSVAQGQLVTSTGQLLGIWWAVELDGQDVEDVRDRNGDPLVVSFIQLLADGGTRWGANDGCNDHFGAIRVSAGGRWSAKDRGQTAVACPHLQEYPENPGAVAHAEQGRILPAAGASAKRLVLLKDDRVLGVYVFQPETGAARGQSGTALTSGAGNGDGMAAEVRGRLTMSKDDCLGLGGRTAVFPQGTSWSAALGVLILPDGTTARLGDVLSGGGGYLPPAFARTWVEDKDPRGACSLSKDVPVFNKGSTLTVDH